MERGFYVPLEVSILEVSTTEEFGRPMLVSVYMAPWRINSENLRFSVQKVIEVATNISALLITSAGFPPDTAMEEAWNWLRSTIERLFKNFPEEALFIIEEVLSSNGRQN
jgi:hypothetical protein